MLHFFLAFLLLFFCEVFCLFSVCPSCSWFFLLVSESSSASVESSVPSATGSSLWAEAVSFEFSELLLLPCHAHAFLVPLCWLLSASLFFLLSCSPLPVGLFFSGGPSSSSSVGGFGTFFVLLWFSLGLFRLVCRLLSSRFPLPSSGSSLVLFWSPSLPAFCCLGWILFLCVCSP